jgi:hypothetical protein
MSYTFNLEVVNINPDKLLNIRFAEGKDSMEQVGVDDWVFSNTAQITKTDEQLKNTSLFGLVYEAYRPLLDDRDFGIVILGVGSSDTYKFFIKEFITSNPVDGSFFLYNRRFLSRNERIIFRDKMNDKSDFDDPKSNLDKNDLYGWCTTKYRKGSHTFDIKIFPYPLPDIVTGYDKNESKLIYCLNGLPKEFRSTYNKTQPMRSHEDILSNIILKFMALRFSTFHELGKHPNPEKNINSANFQKKYLKYKKKYLQLKNR